MRFYRLRKRIVPFLSRFLSIERKIEINFEFACKFWHWKKAKRNEATTNIRRWCREQIGSTCQREYKWIHFVIVCNLKSVLLDKWKLPVSVKLIRDYCSFVGVYAFNSNIENIYCKYINQKINQKKKSFFSSSSHSKS